jgi:hypothetical protein
MTFGHYIRIHAKHVEDIWFITTNLSQSVPFRRTGASYTNRRVAKVKPRASPLSPQIIAWHYRLALRKMLSTRVLLSSRQNCFSKLFDPVGLGKKSGILNKQRGHAICLAVARCVDHAQARAKFDSFPG